MGSCEHSGEPSFAVSEAELSAELGALGVGDGHDTVDCLLGDEDGLDNDNIVEESGLECEYVSRSEGTLCNSVSERLEELVVEPLTSLDISLQSHQSGKGFAVKSSFDDYCLENEVRTLKGGVGRVTDKYQSDLDGLRGDFSGERNSEEMCGGLDLTKACVGGATKRGNVSVIECVLNRIPFDEIQCKGEIDLHQIKVPEVVLDTIHGGAVYDGIGTSLSMSDKSTTDITVTALNVDHIIGSLDDEADAGNVSARIVDERSELNCLYTPLSLRRSSRSRKTVQKVQGGNNAIKTSKKASKLTISRTVDLFSEATRKKRSCRSRSICSSGWGLAKNFFKYFEQSKEVSAKQVLIEVKPEMKAGKKSKKRSTFKVVASSPLAEEKQALPCRPIRLKVTFGKKEEKHTITCFQPGADDHISVSASITQNISGNVIDDQVTKETLMQCSSLISKVEFGGTNSDHISVSASNIQHTSGNVMDDQVPKEMPTSVQCSSSTSKFQFKGTNSDHISISASNTQNTIGHVMDDQVPKEMSTSVQCSSLTSKVQFRVTNSDSDSFQLVEPEKLSSSNAAKFEDPGTSPDSEVIDSSVGPNLLLNRSEKNISSSFPAPQPLRLRDSSKPSKKKRNKKDKLSGAASAGVQSQHSTKKAEKSKKVEMCQKSKDNFCTNGTNVPSENPSSNTTGSGSELVLTELLSVAEESFQKVPILDNGADSILSHGMIGIESADSGNSNHLRTPETLRKKKPKDSKTKGKLKNQPKTKDAKSNKKGSSGQRKVNKKLASKREVRETSPMVEAHQDKGQQGAGNLDLVAVENTGSSVNMPPQNLSCPSHLSNVADEQIFPPRVAWVCCEECEKWRCIPAKLADVIEETNGKWTCKDNQDQAFADCSIPQEKSNEDINAELQISDEDDGRGGHSGSKSDGIRPPGDPQQSTWMLIKTNLFLHRRRKTQTMDEVMVCHCKPPVDGTLGCGSQCLNRMLNIECVHGTCPCGDLCSNQLFQRRLYANLSWFRSGRKGYGLQVLEDISEGKFLIEYVGEVLDLQSYEARQQDYASKGHKHFYFMTLNGNEVIDACCKGNLGRFVNHSCDPNCRTEKWVVNGEICVGLFAQRNIRKGEELTFDYNYVRVFGAAAKKCYCGALKCRGYIGGDPLNAEIVIQGDSDDEFPEPIAIDENGELDRTLEKNMVDQPRLQDQLKGDPLHERCSAEVVPVETSVKITEESSNIVVSHSKKSSDLVATDEICDSSHILAAVAADEQKYEPLVAVQQLESTPDSFITSSTSSKSDTLPIESAASLSLPSSVDSSMMADSSMMPESIIAESERPLIKQHPRMKISRPSKSVKNRKSSSILTYDEKALQTAQPLRYQMLPCKPKKLLEGSGNGHLEEVEEKLNELLDGDGGICKKKDASKGYLRLLLLTAASGDSGNGGAIKSNRELSMILDAFLKTKSRGVLLDIISKNGLQMLHNMIKLYRKDFKKTPILRKLLKVLEFLAEKEILSVERIIDDSRRPGVESFRESILNLTEHEDKKVHQIARNFRDRWIPRPLRNRYNVMDNIDRRREFSRSSNCNRFSGSYHPWREQGLRMSEPIEQMKQSASVNHSSDTRISEACQQSINFQTIMNRPRKRKSRWDQPADVASPKRCKEQKFEPFIPGIIKSSPKAEAASEEKDCIETDDVMENAEDDIPPGFSCLQNDEDSPPGFLSSPPPASPSSSPPPGFPSSSHPAQNSNSLECPSVVSVGLLQEKFNPRLPVAYGIPFSVLEQFGTVESQVPDSWAIAPAFPFKPFPPLPPYPCNKKSHHLRGDTQQGLGMPSSSGPSLPQMPNLGPTNQNMSHHARSWNRPLPSCSRDKKSHHVHDDAQQGLGMPSSLSSSLPHVPYPGSTNQDMSYHVRGYWNGPPSSYPCDKKSHHVPVDAQQDVGMPSTSSSSLPYLPNPCPTNQDLSHQGKGSMNGPLPPCPRNKKCHHFPGDAQQGLGMPSSSGPCLPPTPNPGLTNQHMSHHRRGTWNGPGRRYNKPKNLRPPWFRNLDRRGFKGNHLRNQVSDKSMETITYEQNDQFMDNVNQNVECAGNSSW